MRKKSLKKGKNRKKKQENGEKKREKQKKVKKKGEEIMFYFEVTVVNFGGKKSFFIFGSVLGILIK